MTTAFYIFKDQDLWITKVTRKLNQAGDPKASKSSVVREAITRLREELEGKSDTDITRDFFERSLKRLK